jgi:hypothetical protein
VTLSDGKQTYVIYSARDKHGTRAGDEAQRPFPSPAQRTAVRRLVRRLAEAIRARDVARVRVSEAEALELDADRGRRDDLRVAVRGEGGARKTGGWVGGWVGGAER